MLSWEAKGTDTKTTYNKIFYPFLSGIPQGQKKNWGGRNFFQALQANSATDENISATPPPLIPLIPKIRMIP